MALCSICERLVVTPPFSKGKCRVCRKPIWNVYAPTDVLCEECAKRRNACPHCGRPITQQVAEKTPIRTIAIDGPVAAGKTTTAKILAEKLGFTHLDTGAMYRAIAVKYRDAGERNIEEMLKKTTMRVERCGIYGQKIFVNDFNVTGMLREREISMLASTLSKERSVRQFLLKIQRRFAAEHSVVMEGRDIGTVVLPNADLKIFLTADLNTRAERRLAEMRLHGDYSVSLEALREEFRLRDEQDTNREEAPLCAAEDSIIVDNTELSVAETLKEILTRISAKK